MGIRPSRQANRMYRIMKDPEGPQMKRIDTIVQNSTWEIFRDIRDSMNLTQRQALEYSLQLTYLFLALQDKIPSERFAEIGVMLKEQSKRGPDTESGPETGEPQPA